MLLYVNCHSFILKVHFPYAEPVAPDEANAPRFIEKLQPQHAPDGATVQLECRVEGNPKPQITWFRETAIIKPSIDFQVRYLMFNTESPRRVVIFEIASLG